MKASPKQYAVSLYESLDSVKEKDEVGRKLFNFAEILRKNNDLILIDKIIAEFEKYWNEQKGIVCLNINSANPLSEKEKNQIKKWFENRAGDFIGRKPREIVLKEKIDGNLIGGIVLRTDDAIIDGSIKRQLINLKKQMQY